MNRLQISAIAAVVAAISVQAASARELSYATYQTPIHSTVSAGMVPFFERVEAATNGEVTFKGFYGGAMGGPKELLDNTGSNLVDAAQIVDAYIKSSIPNSAIFSTLGASVESELDMLAYSAAANEQQLLNCPECVADYERNNAILLALTATAPYYVMCAEKTATLADLQGKKVRAVGTVAQLVDMLGAVPVSITSAEMYEAMQRGQVDCTAGATSWLTDFRLGEFSRSLIDAPVSDYISSGTLVMNLDVWKDLEPGHRAVILAETPRLIADANFANLEQSRKAVEEARKISLEVYEPDAAFNEVVETYRAQSWDDAKATAASFEVEAGDRIIDDFRASVEKWRGIMAEIGMDKDAYAEALRREIFSKLQL